MYLRELKRKNRDGKVVRYLQLAHNQRNPQTGTPTARVIHNFGRADRMDRTELARLASSISRFLEPNEHPPTVASSSLSTAPGMVLAQALVPLPTDVHSTTTGDSTFPVVLYAGDVQFAAGGRLSFQRVESRLVMVCQSGRGSLVVNGHPFQVTEGMVLILPWAPSITYVADDADPFRIVDAHLIPQHSAGVSLRLDVAHGPDHDLAGIETRRDDPALAGTDVVVGTVYEYPDLADIVNYAVRLLTHDAPDEETLRALGRLVVHELRGRTGRRRPPHPSRLPIDLRRIVSHVDRHLDSALTASALAHVAGYSESTLSRRFRAYLDDTPMAWVTARRLRRATDLLRTTTLTVSQIARRCGFSDPLYFSRLFRRQFGKPPKTWRRSHGVI